MTKAEELVLAHQEYQRSLQVFEQWLEQQQETLGSCSQLEGDVENLESTLQKLQVRTWVLFLCSQNTSNTEHHVCYTL